MKSYGFHQQLFIHIFCKVIKLINHIKGISLKLNKEIEMKIKQLLCSDAVNYLETSERLILNNILHMKVLSQLETNNLYKIIEKYKKFIKN